jgi:hypothetical protein
MTDVQRTRRENLRTLMETFHRGSSFGDYEHEYASFEMAYFGTIDGEEPEDEGCEPTEREEVPKYASCASDETYGMISTWETLEQALQHQSNIPSNGEYLNVPAGIYDLDNGAMVDTVTITMTRDAFASLCGLVSTNDSNSDVLDGGTDVNKDGIFAPWDELRTLFPIGIFREWAEEHDPDDGNDYGYVPGFGL